jgi:bacterioferritin-associated ferredoxin
MIVCHCKGVTDRAIREAVRQGALTRTDVSRTCNAGGCCMGCHPLIERIIDQEGGCGPVRADANSQVESRAY